MDPRIKALMDRRAELLASMKALTAAGSLTEDQGKEFDAMEAECAAIPAKIKEVEALIQKDQQRAAALAKLETVPAILPRNTPSPSETEH